MYLGGLGHSLLRLFKASRLLHSLAASGCAAAPLARAPGLGLIDVDAPISPMLFGLFKPRLLLPLHMRHLESAQQEMILEHELMHWRRRDLYWTSAGRFPANSLLVQSLHAAAAGTSVVGTGARLRPRRARWPLACPTQGRRGSARVAADAAAASREHGARCWRRQRGPGSRPDRADPRAWRRSGSVEPSGRGWRPGWHRCVQSCLQPALASHGDALVAARQSGMECTVMLDADSGQRLLHEGQCDERVTLASTFNIASSLMGYDSGILQDEHAPALPFKAGYADWMPSWRATTDPARWFENSVLWYAQQVTLQPGRARFELRRALRSWQPGCGGRPWPRQWTRIGLA